ncbi:hypothetical protein [Brevibacillus borstelensis]
MKTEVKAVFQDFNAGAKKDVIKFEVKGDLTDEQIVALHKLKGGTVFVQISSSQMDIDDIEDEETVHEGIGYTVNGDGTVHVDSSQLSLDDVPDEEEEVESEENDSDELDVDDELPESEAANDEPGEGSEEKLDESAPAADNVADLSTERKRRGRPKKEEQQPQNVDDNDTLPTADDDLPF